jgi:hypothetical protein
MYKVLIVGHNRPPNPEFPEAQLPLEVAIWDSTKVPETRPLVMENVEVVFFDTSIPTRIQDRLQGMFRGKMVMRLSSTALFHSRLRLYFPLLADDVIRYLSEKDPFPFIPGEEPNPRGGMRWQSRQGRPV